METEYLEYDLFAYSNGIRLFGFFINVKMVFYP